MNTSDHSLHVCTPFANNVDHRFRIPLASSALSYATNQMNMAENNTPQAKTTKMKNNTSPLEENKETKETLSSQGQPDVSDSVRSRMNYQPTVNVGLIGHVAHGKSTLTKALSTVTTGRHAKEAERSMTIKLGYANSKIFKCNSPQCPEPFCYRATGSEQMQPPMCLRTGCGSAMHLIQHVSFVDAPGHHDLMSTMLTGAAVMDGALLVVASNEPCPSPQTSEHLAAAQMMGLRLGHNIACVQTKLDVGSLPEILANKRDIEHFLTKAAELNEEKLTHPVPIVPIAAHMGLNIDAVIQALLRLIPSAPQRDPAAPARMLVVRSFDVNKPGASVSSLKGGVVGGSLVQGTLALGQVVEIRPGLVSRDGRATPISSRVVSLQSESHHLKSVVPGGLIAVGLEIDPILAKADNLVGHVVGVPGTLPPVFRKFRASVESLRTVSHLKGSKHSGKQHEKPSFSKNQVFQCSIGSMRAQGVCTKVTSSSRGAMTVEMELRLPVCAEADARVAFFSKGDENNPSSWRLAASGSLLSISEMELTPVSVDSFAQSVSFNAEESAPAVQPDAKPVVPVETKTKTSESSKSASEATAVPAAAAASATAAIVPSAAAAELTEKKELRPIPRTALQKEEDLKVRWYPHELPEVGELVMVMVDRIDTKFGGAYVKLLEFGNLEALASQSELSQQRVRSLKQVAHVSRREVMVVLRVDKEKGMIDVSKKRVSPRDRLLHESWFNQSRVMHSIFSRTASVLGCPMLTLYESVGWHLYELAQEATAKAAADAAETKVDDDAESTSSKKEKKKSGDKRKKEKDAPDASPSAANKKSSAVVIHPLDLLQQMVDPSAGAAAQELRESLQADGEVEERLLEVLFQNVYHRLVMKSVKVKATLELSCLTPQGITAIQQVLAQVLREFNNRTRTKREGAVEEEEDEEEEEEEESSVEAPEIFLIASPHFQISSASRDKQKAIRLIERACARVVELMKQTGGHAAIITPAEAFVQ